MVIWRITGNEIGPHGNGAAHFPTREAAQHALVEYRKWCRENGQRENGEIATAPEKIIIRNREQLADALNDAMGYGCS